MLRSQDSSEKCIAVKIIMVTICCAMGCKYYMALIHLVFEKYFSIWQKKQFKDDNTGKREKARKCNPPIKNHSGTVNICVKQDFSQ